MRIVFPFLRKTDFPDGTHYAVFQRLTPDVLCLISDFRIMISDFPLRLPDLTGQLRIEAVEVRISGKRQDLIGGKLDMAVPAAPPHSVLHDPNGIPQFRPRRSVLVHPAA